MLVLSLRKLTTESSSSVDTPTAEAPLTEMWFEIELKVSFVAFSMAAPYAFPVVDDSTVTVELAPLSEMSALSP